MTSRTVLVIGAAKGIGKSTAEFLSRSHFSVYAVDHDDSALSRLGSVIERTALDIEDRPAIKTFVGKLKDHGRRFRAAIITAGVHSSYPIEYLPDDVIDRVMNVNFTAHAKFIRDIIPLVEPQGRIIGVSSIGATVGQPMSSIYSASKGALELFYEALSTELRYRAIHAVIIQPGNVNTGFNETGNSFSGGATDRLNEDYKNFVAKIDSSLGMPPEAVARAIQKAVLTPSPRLCYVVGGNALKAYWARRLLGREAAVWLLRRHFGLQ